MTYNDEQVDTATIIKCIRQLGFGSDLLGSGESAQLHLTVSRIPGVSLAAGSDIQAACTAISNALQQLQGVTSTQVSAQQRSPCSRTVPPSSITVQYDPLSVGGRALEAAAQRVVDEKYSAVRVQVGGGSQGSDASVASMLQRLYVGGATAAASAILAYALPLAPATLDRPLDMAWGGAGLLTPREVVQAGLATASLLYVGGPIARAAYAAAVYSRMMTMDTLVTVSSGAAWAVSTGLLAASTAKVSRAYLSEPLYETTSILLALVMVGRAVEHVAKRRTAAALRSLSELQYAPSVLVQTGGAEASLTASPCCTPSGCSTGACATTPSSDFSSHPTRPLPSSLIQLGDCLRVSPGQRFPCDGTILAGGTAVDEVALTGEATPVSKSVGDAVVGGTSNVEGVTYIRVSALPGQGAVAHIVAQVEQAAASRPQVQLLADWVASLFTPAIFAASLTAYGVWYVLGERGLVNTEGAPPAIFALNFSLALLVVSCPCAVGLAVPVAVMVAVLVGTRHGALIKGGPCLERLLQVKDVVFDKSGTLTTGAPRLAKVHLLMQDRQVVGAGKSLGFTAEAVGALPSGDSLTPGAATLLALASDAEVGSTHPLAQAVCQAASKGVHVKKAAAAAAVKQSKTGTCSATEPGDDRTSIPGCGIVSRAPSGSAVYVGKLAWAMEQAQVEEDSEEAQEAQEEAKQLEGQGYSLIAVATAGCVLGLLACSDSVRVEAKGVVSRLQEGGYRVWVASGDNAGAVQAVAKELGIPSARALSCLLPAHKSALITSIRAGDHPACGETHTRVAVQGDEKAGLLAPARADKASTLPTSVMMVGDGINDAVALTAADVGVAMGAGTGVACDCADVVLAKSDLKALLMLFKLAKATRARIRWNFAWAFLYNLVSMPLAAGMLYTLAGVRVPPSLAGASELLSSVPVVAGSLLLLRFKA